jgi:hypothetical protein
MTYAHGEFCVKFRPKSFVAFYLSRIEKGNGEMVAGVGFEPTTFGL